MPDVLTPEQRHRNMAAIRSKDTKPELIVRSLVHRMGYRYRLHRNDLPGRPDLVFPGLRKVIFVHGCFWHMHRCKNGQVTPHTNAYFWRKKRESNVRRDQFVRHQLTRSGWRVMTVWECQIRKVENLETKLESFLRCK